MPHRTIWEQDGITWEFFGRVSLEEIATANTEFYKDHRSDSSKYQIFDGLGIEEIVGSDAEVKMLAAVDLGASKSIKHVKVALVLGDDALIPMAEGYIEYSQKLESTWQFGIFGTLDEARDWVQAELDD